MHDPVEINRRNWDERVVIHARDHGGAYGLDRFRAGADALSKIEASELGDIAGKRVLHLQCHIGNDTLSLVRRGATVTGLDFSTPALDVARKLSAETSLPATFVHGRVDDAPRLTPGPFDLVYTTWGTICWLPDLKPWARAIAAVLKEGGELYFADLHPSLAAMEVRDGLMTPTFDFQTPPDKPLSFNEPTTYTSDPTPLVNSATREWIHSLSTIIGVLLDAGLTLTMFREHEVIVWKANALLVPASPRTWRLPNGHPRMPLSFSLRAQKGSAA